MAVVNLPRMGTLGEVLRDLPSPRRVPIYLATAVAGAAIGLGIASFGNGGAAQPGASAGEPEVAPIIQKEGLTARFAPEAETAALTQGERDAIVSSAPESPAVAEIAVDVAPAPPAVAESAPPGPSAPAAAPATSGAPVTNSAPAQPATQPVTQPVTEPAPPAAEQPAPPPPAPSEPALPANFYLPSVGAVGGMSGLEAQMFELMNAERAAAGLPAYAWDASLSRIARIRGHQMIDQGYFGHRDPYGYTMYAELLAYFGIGFRVAGENLVSNGYAYDVSASLAVEGLMNSPTHRANMLDPNFTRVGVGEVTSPGGGHYYALIFLQ